MDFARDDNLVEDMEWVEIGEGEIVDRVKRLKNGSAARPDIAKGNLLKEIV